MVDDVDDRLAVAIIEGFEGIHGGLLSRVLIEQHSWKKIPWMAKNREILSLPEWREAEKTAVEEFLTFFRSTSDVTLVVYTTWTAKDVLGHIASWHMSFARNLLAAVRGEKPRPFRGTLGSINESEVTAMAAFTAAELMAKIEEAQTTIDEHILNPAVTEIVYRAGARSYAPLEHLEVVTRHIRQHLTDIRKEAHRKALP